MQVKVGAAPARGVGALSFSRPCAVFARDESARPQPPSATAERFLLIEDHFMVATPITPPVV